MTNPKYQIPPVMQPFMPDSNTGEERAAFRSSHALGGAKAWHRHAHARRRPFLILVGPTGCGKTLAASWCVAQPLWWPRPDADNRSRRGRLGWTTDEFPRYVTAPQLGNLVDWKEAWDELCGCAVLAIDDLGTESSEQAAVIARVIAERDGLGGPTILTTNLGRKPLAQRYGERTLSRLQGVGWFIECVQRNSSLVDGPAGLIDLRGKCFPRLLAKVPESTEPEPEARLSAEAIAALVAPILEKTRPGYLQHVPAGPAARNG